jgi:hypothetical protein
MKHARGVKLTLLAAAFWLGGAVLYWSQLPLPGRVLIRSDNSLYVLGFDRSGALAVARLQTPRSGWTPVGPLTFHNTRTGESIKTCVPPGARLLTRTFAGDFVVVQTDHEIHLVSLVDGGTIVRHPYHDGGRIRTDISPSGDRFLVVTDDTLVLYDTQSGAQLWSRDEVGKSMFLGDDAIEARIKRPPAELAVYSTAGKDVRLDVQTGESLELIYRPFDEADCGMGRRSPNGAYTMAWSSNDGVHPPGLYDNATGELQWEFGPEFKKLGALFQLSLPLKFSADSTQVHATYGIGKRSLGTARWSVPDGRVLDPVPPTATFKFDDIVPYFSSPDGRWSLIGLSSHTAWGRLPQSLRVQIAGWSPFTLDTAEWAQNFAVVDNRWDHVVGTMPKSRADPLLIPDGSGIVAADEFEVRRYDLPPDRRFLWLLGWGVTPATLLIAIGIRRARATTSDSLVEKHAGGAAV